MSQQIEFAFRITHILNIPHILKYGIVRADSPDKNPDFIPIGDKALINERKELSYNGESLENWIPFYFGPRSPMLYKIQNGYGVKQYHPQEIIYIVIRLKDIMDDKIDCVFTDRHAMSCYAKYFDKDSLKEINSILNPKELFAIWWNDPDNPGLKTKKEVELLLKHDLPVKYIVAYGVYNEKAKADLINYGISGNMIKIVPDSYYPLNAI